MDRLVFKTAAVVFLSLFINSEFIDNPLTKTRVALISLTFSLFFFSLEYMIRTIKRGFKSYRFITSLWLTFFTLENLFGLTLGYIVTTSDFMSSLKIIIMLYITHMVFIGINKYLH